jgi:hypothetical protein
MSDIGPVPDGKSLFRALRLCLNLRSRLHHVLRAGANSGDPIIHV